MSVDDGHFVRVQVYAAGQAITVIRVCGASTVQVHRVCSLPAGRLRESQRWRGV